jgi:hypothetical protein
MTQALQVGAGKAIIRGLKKRHKAKINNKDNGSEVMSEAVPSVVAIDIGTHKVSVLIGKVHAPDNIQVIGMATARNRGMNKGKIVSLIK